MKNVIKLLSILFLIVTFVACSDEPPSFRVKNDRTQQANVQIKTVSNTININEALPGSVTNYQEVPKGNVIVTAVIQSESFSPEASFNAEVDNNYTVVIANTTPPSIRIDVTNK